MWESERGEEAVECIDFFCPPSSFLKLIKVLAWFSDYPTAYGDFLPLKGSACCLLLPPLAVSPSPLLPFSPVPQMPAPPLIYIARGVLLWNYN